MNAIADPPFSTYMVLGTITLIALGTWILNPNDRRRMLILGGVGLLLLLLWVCDLLMESGREKAVSAVKDMQKSFNAGRQDQAFSHLSDKFEYKGMDRNRVAELAKSPVADEQLKGIAFGSFDREYVKYEGSKVTIGFRATVPIQPLGYWVMADFEPDDQGRMKLRTFRIHNIARRTDGPEETVPFR